MHPGVQFLIFVVLFLGLLFAGTILALGLTSLLYGPKAALATASLSGSQEHFKQVMWILQILGTTLPIFLTPFIFAKAIVGEPAAYLRLNTRFNWLLLVLVIVVMFLSMPLIEWLSDVNASFNLPQSLRDYEQEVNKTMNKMLEMNSVWQLLANIFLIALLTAIVEELMFRGALQTILLRWTGNIHAAIWVGAALFSAMHMEFSGFLPRMALGVIFGYLVAWSGSIWPAILAHFLNNGTDVVITYLFQNKITKVDPDDQHMFNLAGYIISFIILLVLMLVYRKIALDKKQMLVTDGEELG